jgi:mono/diheme cytochrome c family protein
MSIVATLAVSASAQDLDHGRRLAQRWCAECHAIGPEPTTFRRAPPFAALAYKDNITIETLRAFLLMPHATMSNVPLSDTDAQDIAAFIIAMKK